jgi:TPP-dependent indolepyruvate ferredoxin oxidoreductase alpha subunit
MFEKLLRKGLDNRKNNIKETQVVIVNAECALMVKNSAEKKWALPRGAKKGSELYLTISENCIRCHECYARFGCTAIKCIEHDEKGIEYIIDEGACLKEYCKACIDVCPNHCIQKIIIDPNEEPLDKYPEKKRNAIKKEELSNGT